MTFSLSAGERGEGSPWFPGKKRNEKESCWPCEKGGPMERKGRRGSSPFPIYVKKRKGKAGDFRMRGGKMMGKGGRGDKGGGFSSRSWGGGEKEGRERLSPFSATGRGKERIIKGKRGKKKEERVGPRWIGKKRERKKTTTEEYENIGVKLEKGGEEGVAECTFTLRGMKKGEGRFRGNRGGKGD